MKLSFLTIDVSNILQYIVYKVIITFFRTLIVVYGHSHGTTEAKREGKDTLESGDSVQLLDSNRNVPRRNTPTPARKTDHATRSTAPNDGLGQRISSLSLKSQT